MSLRGSRRDRMFVPPCLAQELLNFLPVALLGDVQDLTGIGLLSEAAGTGHLPPRRLIHRLVKPLFPFEQAHLQPDYKDDVWFVGAYHFTFWKSPTPYSVVVGMIQVFRSLANDFIPLTAPVFTCSFQT